MEQPCSKEYQGKANYRGWENLDAGTSFLVPHSSGLHWQSYSHNCAIFDTKLSVFGTSVGFLKWNSDSCSMTIRPRPAPRYQFVFNLIICTLYLKYWRLTLGPKSIFLHRQNQLDSNDFTGIDDQHLVFLEVVFRFPPSILDPFQNFSILHSFILITSINRTF